MKYLICLAALLWAGMKLTAADNVKEVEIKIIETGVWRVFILMSRSSASYMETIVFW